MSVDAVVRTVCLAMLIDKPLLLILFCSGDAGSFLLRLSKGLKGHKCPEEWPQSLKEGDISKEKVNRSAKSTYGHVTFNQLA